MSISKPPPTSPRPIGQAHVQFIEQSFAEFFGVANPGDASFAEWRSKLIHWIYRRIFEDRISVAAVRAELSATRRETRTIAVTSGKGGVGKTTFAVNLAVACAQLGSRVLLFDADLGMANVHIYAGVNPPATLLDVVDGRARMDDVITPGPCGVQLICGASGISRIADIGALSLDAIGRELLRVAAGFDVLIMDTGAGIALSVTHFIGLAQDTIVVATPNIASTLDAYGIIKVAHDGRLPTRMHLLVNQAENEAQAADVFERIAGCTRRFLNASPGSLGFLPRDLSVERSNQNRSPLALTDPGNASIRRIAAIAARITGDESHAQHARTAIGTPPAEHAAA